VLQLGLVGIIVMAAMAFVARSAWQTWFGKRTVSCGSGCGKCAPTAEETKQSGRFPLPQS
jgi:hypothetical protein